MNKLLLTALVCLLASPALAKSGWEAQWATVYPNSKTDDNVISAQGLACGLCHNGTNFNQFNGYGYEVLKGINGNLPILEAIKAAESKDSDGDPAKSTNLVEINGDFQPGWTAGNNNIIYSKSGGMTANQPPLANLAMLDPAVVNQPPVAAAGGPYTGTVGAPVAFDGSGSKDDGTIVTYAWNFGDGMTGTGAKPSHTYAAAGTYTVTLTVTDNMNATGNATATATIVAANQPPVASAGGPYAGTVGAPLTFDGSGSKDDGTIVTYAWTFGDGMTGTGAKPTHTYAAAGTYAVTLTVTDNMNATGNATTSAVIVAGNVAPVAVDDAYKTPINTPLQISAPGVLQNDTDGNMDALTAKMVAAPVYGTLQLMADGSFLYTPNPDYTGPDSFTYQANDGKADSAPATVALTVEPPVVLDLDIGAFRTSKRARVASRGIGFTLVVLGITGDGAAKTATLVGTQNGAEVYKETIEIAQAAGTRGRYGFPEYVAQAAGEIAWTVTLNDDDTDVDTESASTLVVE